MKNPDKTERELWVMNYIRTKSPCGVDILNSDFVDAYIAAFNAPHRFCCWGAFKCRELGKILSGLHRRHYLKRGTIGLGLNWQPGFPRWVYAYWLNE